MAVGKPAVKALGLVAVVVSIGTLQPAHAQALVDVLCPGNRTSQTGDVRALRDSLLNGVSFQTLDANRDDAVSANEAFAAMTDPAYCSDTLRATKCIAGDLRKLLEARNSMTTLWEKPTDIEIIRRRPVTAADITERPGLAKEAWAPLLDERGAFFEVRCTRPLPAATSDTPPSGKTVATKLGLPPLLVGKDVDSLTVRRTGGPDGLQRVAQAEVGYEVDRIDNRRTINIDAVIGVRLIDTGQVTVIPFVEYVRSDVRDRSANSDQRTGKLGLGAVATMVRGNDQFDLAPRYTRDLKNRSELFGARLAWRPGFLYGLKIFQNEYPLICFQRATRNDQSGCRVDDEGKQLDGLSLSTDFQLVGTVGTVLRDGIDPLLIRDRRFVRVGPSAAAHLYGAGRALRNFSLDVFYKRLIGITGDGTSIGDFRADLNYWIAGSRNISLVYGYERSQDEETLDRVDRWRLGLGVRF